MARTATRKLAFTIVFQADFGQDIDFDWAIEEFGRQVDPGFLRQLVEGVLPRRQFLDDVISEFSRGWTASRLPRVDRALLRLAIWEILKSETPPAVIINEAVELAKEYGTAESPGFINGVLDNIRIQREELAARMGD